MSALALFGCDAGPGPLEPGDPPSPPAVSPAPTPAGEVMVRVERSGAPEPGVQVIFHEPDGSVFGQAITADDGRAWGTALSGSLVSVVRAEGEHRSIATTWGVEPGDEIVFIVRATPVDPEAGIVRVQLPGAVANATRYAVDAGCHAESMSDPGQPIALDLHQSCLTGPDGSVNVLATAHDASGAPLAWSFLRGLSIENGVAHLPDWSTTWQDVELHLMGAPGEANAALGGGDWGIDGASYPAADEPWAFLSSGIVTLTTRVPAPTAERFTSRVVVGHGDAASLSGVSERSERHDGVPAYVMLNVAGDFLPAVTSPVLDTRDASRPVVRWTAAGSLADADLGTVELGWRDGSATGEWTAIIPPTATAPLAFPRLPEELAAWRPPHAAAFDAPQVSFFDADWVDGYAIVKAQGFDPELPAGPHVVRSTTAIVR
jgi:hypothetical protein